MQTLSVDNINSSIEWRKQSLSKDDILDRDRDSDSSEESSGEHDGVGVYKYMTPANPLDFQTASHPLEVKTAIKFEFQKLPDFNRKAKQCENPQDCDGGLFKIGDKAIEKRLSQSTNETEADLRDRHGGRSLFSLYPEGDSRLVYRKYKSNTTMGENRVYSGYLIDLQKLSKGKDSVIQYRSQSNSGDTMGTIIKNDGTHLVFNSLFESGNLFAAFKLSETEYDLILQNDFNTKGNTQWFFFSVSNTKKNVSVKFNIMNLIKPDSLFNQGMKPVVFSEKENQMTGDSWKREGFAISYYKNYIMKECQSSGSSYYTLTFSYQFKHDEDTVYFAHCYPYTYTDLNNYLTKLTKDPSTKQYMTRKVLCKTLAKNTCEYLTITSGKNVQNLSTRSGIVISARQHPGESLSSHMMQGVIDFLLSEQEEAIFLRDTCVFRIIPMLNPDGVIHGNYRTGLGGVDLNRRWKKTDKSLFPTVYAAKTMIKKFASSRPLEVVCDLHGHSRKKSSFFYGCTDEKDPTKSRLLPYILSKITDMFSFESSRFSIHKSKESTARVALWREYRIPNIFTLEASFYGYDTPTGRAEAYSIDDFMNIGKSLCKAIYIYITHIKGVSRVTEVTFMAGSPQKPGMADAETQCAPQKLVLNAKDLMTELKENKKLIKYGDMSSDSGSDSAPSDDELPKEHLVKILPKKMRSKLAKKLEEEKIKQAKRAAELALAQAKAIEVVPKTNEAEVKKPVKAQGVVKIKPPMIIAKRRANEPLKGIDRETQTEEPIFDILILIDKGSPVAKQDLEFYQITIIAPRVPLSTLVDATQQNNRTNPGYLRKIDKHILQQPQLYITTNVISKTKQGFQVASRMNKTPKHEIEANESINKTIMPQPVSTDPSQEQGYGVDPRTDNKAGSISEIDSLLSDPKDRRDISQTPAIVNKKIESPAKMKMSADNVFLPSSNQPSSQPSEEQFSVDTSNPAVKRASNSRELEFKIRSYKTNERQISLPPSTKTTELVTRKEIVRGRVLSKSQAQNQNFQDRPYTAALLLNAGSLETSQLNGRVSAKQITNEQKILNAKPPIPQLKAINEDSDNANKRIPGYKHPKSLSKTRNARTIKKISNDYLDRSLKLSDVLRKNAQYYEMKYDKNNTDNLKLTEESMGERNDTKRISKDDVYRKSNSLSRSQYPAQNSFIYSPGGSKPAGYTNNTEADPVLYSTSYPTEQGDKSSSPGNRNRKKRISMANQGSALFIVKEQPSNRR